MRVLTIGTDRKLFEEGSAVEARALEYASQAEGYYVIVRTTSGQNISERHIGNLHIYPTSSFLRVLSPFDAYLLGKKIVRRHALSREDTMISAEDPFESGFSGFLLSKWSGFPLQLQIHVDFLSSNFKNSLLNIIRRIIAAVVIPKAKGLRVVSSVIADSIRKAFPSLEARVDVLPIFIDIAKIENRIIQKNIKTDFPQFSYIIFMASRLTPEKQIEKGVYALEQVLKKFPSIGLVISGEGSEKKSFQNLSHILGIEKSIVFSGWIEDIISYLKSADVYLLTSGFEGYGMSLIEAGASGCPIVTTKVGVAKTDLFKNGENSFVCPVGDIECLSRAIVELISDPAKRKSFAEKMQNDIRAIAISKEEYIEKYIGLLKKLVEKNDPGSRADRSTRASSVHGLLTTGRVKKSWDFGNMLLDKYVGLRFFIAGGFAGVTDLVFLYILHNFLGIYYLLSAILAFLGAFGVSFFLHKFWTFKSHGERTHKQAVMYFGASLFGLCLNTLLMYIFVDHFHIYVILSQIIVGLLVALVSFFISRNLVFKYK